MPKSILIEPEKVFASDTLRLLRFPINAYQQDFRRGAAPTYSAEDFLDIWRDMCGIREFETILNEIKIKGAYQGSGLQPRRPGAPLDRTGSRRGRHGVLA